MLKSLLLFVTFLFSVLPLSAGSVDRDEALQIASRWWGVQSRGVGEEHQTDIEIQSMTDTYLCSRLDEFLLIAADDRLPQILGHGKFRGTGIMPPALEAMLRQPSVVSAYPPIGAEWKVVEPLLTTIRHQEAPYNMYCPIYRFDGGELYTSPCLVGCVATAMEQILTYYRRVYEVKETIKGWETEHYKVEDIPAGMSVDTRIIRDNYDDGQATDAEIDAVARLSYYLGQACEMDWGIGASGAESRLMGEGVQRYFGVKYMHYLDSYQYAPAAYWNFVAAEIAARRPVYYAGSIMRTGGHAFVVDGLDKDGLFHVNWGYGGDYDGYFRLDVLAHPQPEGNRHDDFVESGFFCNQQAIAVHPDEITDAFVPAPLDRKGDEVEIESVIFGEKPLLGCHTPVYLCLHNRTMQALTTPFALLENEPSDTNRVEQAEWLAMTGRTLEAGERDTVQVNARFTRSGKLIFSITPDGETMIYSQKLDVSEGGTDWIETEVPQIEALSATSVTFSQHMMNTSATERAAQNFVYDLQDRETETDGQIEHFIYLDAGADTTDVVQFKGLKPGHCYTLRVRLRWPIVQTLDFTTPSATAVMSPVMQPVLTEERWYTLDGRHIQRPTVPGVYLKIQGHEVQKILITTSR